MNENSKSSKTSFIFGLLLLIALISSCIINKEFKIIDGIAIILLITSIIISKDWKSFNKK